MRDLTDKQRAFVVEYPVDFNATQAAIRAGYSKKTARFIGAENLTKPNIQEAIRERVEKHAERADLTTERVFEEYRRLALSDLRDVVSWNRFGVTLKDSGQLSDEAAAAVREVTESVTDREDGGMTVRRSVKLHDKLGALRDVAKILGMFPKDGSGAPAVNVNVKVDNRSVKPLSEFTDEELALYESLLSSEETPSAIAAGDRLGQRQLR